MRYVLIALALIGAIGFNVWFAVYSNYGGSIKGSWGDFNLEVKGAGAKPDTLEAKGANAQAKGDTSR